jgi:hypothetical protein
VGTSTFKHGGNLFIGSVYDDAGGFSAASPEDYAIAIPAREKHH